MKQGRRIVCIFMMTFVVLALGMPIEASSQNGQDKAAVKPRREATVLYQEKEHLSGPERAALARVESRYGLRLVRKLVAEKVNKAKAHGVKFLSEEEICTALMDSGAVVFAEPDYLERPVYIPNDPGYPNQWHHSVVDSPTAWSVTIGSSSIIVAVCDTGVQSKHPDLASNLILPGYNVVDGSTNTEDSHGHGTSVAGCIAAIGDNGIGVAGMGWELRMLPIRISNSSDGSAYISHMAEAMRYAVDHGAKVVNLSYGGAYSSTIDAAAKYVRGKGALHFMAAGNSGKDISAQPDWASFILVGATDSLDRRASFSNYGKPIDVVAPGVSIRTTRRGSTYGSVSGTSFASPITAGLAALIYSLDPGFTPDQVEQFIFSTCADLGAAGEDNVFGYGRIDAGLAIVKAQLALENQSREPIAIAIATPVGESSPLEVFFDGAMSYAADGISEYIWAFGDGAEDSGVTVSYTYHAPGTYTASLVVIDTAGRYGYDEVVVQVDGASADPEPLSAPSGLTATASGSLVTLNWTDNSSKEDGFYVERGQKVRNLTTWARVAQVGANVTAYSESVADGTYLYRVQAFNADEVSDYTATVQVSVSTAVKTGGRIKSK